MFFLKLDLLLVSLLSLSSLWTQVLVSAMLPQAEVDALNQIAKTMRARDWTFDANACDLNDILPVDFGYVLFSIFRQFKRCNLSGTLPPELVQLPYIQKVDFAYNYLNGSIPVEWALLQLKFISVFGNRLSGNIPSHLANITSLTDIEANQFSGTVPEEFRKLVNLETLRLSSNQLSGSLPTGLAELKNLTNFRISDNNFNGSIPEFIQNWKQLERLEMQGSGFDGPIPSSISVLENLKQLKISDIAGTNHPFPDLRNMTGITMMDLSFNRLIGEIPNVATPSSLKFMDLSYNNLTYQSPEQPACLERQNLNLNLFHWHSLHINCGGNEAKINGSTFEGDGQIGGGAATFHLQDDTNWGFSSTGDFADDNDDQNTRYIATSDSSGLSELYINARIAPLSLTYFGYCLDNGNYTLSLHFAEIQFSNGITFRSLGRRLFDIYIQDNLVERNFDIKAEASGVLKPVARSYNVTVTNHIIEIQFKPEKKKVVPIVVGVVAGLSLIILVVSILGWRYYLRTKRRKETGFMKESDLQTISFTLKQIKAATNNFDSAKKIGEGGFGPVYKGQLADGTIIAVKQLSSKSRQGNREFLNEIAMISCLQHPNLVKIHGCCVEGDQLLLVYEYMENNSLARALLGGENSQLKLNWSVRQKICLGIARGLAFLHEESRFKIVHRDIKATNVLLDRDLNPKISDFGLAKLDEEVKTHISTRVAGTIGYMAPEYALWGYLTYKADVYSFGVVALEIVSGKNNMSYVPDSNCTCPLDWLVDPRLGSEFNKVEAERMIKIALLCTNASPSLRPTMSEVVSMLEGSSNIPDVIPEAATQPRKQASQQLVLRSQQFKRCNLSGTLPRELVQLPSIQKVDFAYNYLNGSIPVEWALLQLKFISVFGNRLSGNIPSHLANITSLTDIEANQFSGTVPEEFRKLVNLETLRLSSNQLSGSLPTGLAELKNLTNFRISDNNFNGSIPEFIQNWKQLERLEMQGSGFDGPIPSSISVLENLKQLILRNCGISGEFPEYIWRMNNLRILDLSFNRLTGKIPNVATPPSLKFMDLSYNNFTHQNPEQPACREIQNLNLNLFRNWHSLHINCGGNEVKVNGSTFEGDGQIGGGAATYHSEDDTNWGFSSSGDFTDDDDEQNRRYIATPDSSNLSELYINARIAPLSLTYFGYCLDNGNYTLSLHFAEVQFSNGITFHSLGRRLFDIYIQDKQVERNFDIKAEASGALKPVARSYNVTVTNHIIEIRFHWAGKGTTALPKRGVYGPLVSAISLNDPNFKPEKKKVVPIVVGVVAGLSLIILAFGILGWRYYLRTKRRKERGFMKESDLQTISFTLKQIKAATNNFDSAKKIGEGGFGPVYKGQLADGTIIAVKQLSSKSRQGNREFLNEIAMISCLQHPNLVKIHGCCVEGDQLLLVYEYMENNSLARALFGRENCELELDWPTRQKICLGIARGLAFLHEESRFKIVHRDIKATNVLLDRDLNPKISDFGLAKLDEEDKTHISTRIAGTIGYMAPEYALWGYLTYKADVYSFGIVALEIVSGKNNMSYASALEFDCTCLLDWACHLQLDGKLVELVDERLGSKYNKEEAERMIKVSLLCTNASPSLRPTMSEVVNMLEGKTAIPDMIPEAGSYSQDLRFKALRDQKGLRRSQNSTATQSQHSISAEFNQASSSTSAAQDLYEINEESYKKYKVIRDGFMKESDLQTISFTLKQIKAATNNFDSAKKIGEGGFGPVYKGQLADGTIIAVKQLSSKSRQGNREFLNEIAMISCLQHPNLVKIHGCCVEGDQLLLVYEYMENNSLAHALFGGENSRLKLNWSVRQKICLGIARGLAFLHEESRFKIVHRDIKATNVLLDRDLNPKISDFGLAKLDEEEKTHISTRVAGTIGYMAPEYALWGYLTYKADVYSFGVVALEIVSGKYNMSYVPDSNCSCLLDWLVDPRLGSEFNKVEAEKMIKVALLCTNVSPSLRPTMSEVVSMLEGSSNIPDVIPEAEAYLKFKAMRDSHIHMERQSSVAQQVRTIEVMFVCLEERVAIFLELLKLRGFKVDAKTHSFGEKKER
ncbi:hypothetical protein CUMW_013580 [Citrus unshiu]|nr:hypothetical protein CUMW_013580 [Citrus unshiu]